jgi:hypothetical protein
MEDFPAFFIQFKLVPAKHFLILWQKYIISDTEYLHFLRFGKMAQQ